MHDGVDLLQPRHRVVDVEQSALEVGAAEHRQRRLGERAPGQGARAADRRAVRPETEAVPVVATRLQPGDVDLDGMVPLRPGGGPTPGDHPAKGRVLGDDPAHHARARGGRQGDPGPDDQRAGRGIPRGDAVQEGRLGRRWVGVDGDRGRRHQPEPQEPQRRTTIHPPSPTASMGRG